MFFDISKSLKKNFTKNYHLKNGIFLNLDSGWNTYDIDAKKVFFKGYITEKQNLLQILTSIVNDPTPKYKGNFFCIISDDEKIVLTHDTTRGTPLFYLKNDCVITNLICGQNINANFLCELNYNFDINLKKFKPYVVDDTNLTYGEGLNKIYNLLAEEFELFLSKNDRPIKIFMSGGVDTLIVYSFLKKFTKNFELLDYEFKKFTHFYKHNWDQQIKKFWGYTQMHTWGEEPVALMTGGCGDEFTLRGPETLKLLCDYHDIDLPALLENNKDCYHYTYFTNNEKNKKIFNKEKKNFFNKKYMISYILNILINDHQHWHLDNTLFFTPFKNIKLPNIILNFDKEIIIAQALNAKISKDLIIKNDPADLKFLSKYKNEDNLGST